MTNARAGLIAQATIGAATVFGAAGLLLLNPNDAWPHQAIPTASQPLGWAYPLNCCSGQDCAAIPASRVSTMPDGYHIEVGPGDHQFVTRPTLFIVAYNDRKVKPSPDGEFHLCISREYRGTSGDVTPSRLICFFAPPPSY